MAEGGIKMEIEDIVINNGCESIEESSKKKKYTEFGLDEAIISQLEELFESGKLTEEELDERALNAIKEFPADGALAVLAEFSESSLDHVSNKSAYLCGIMKTYRQKSKAGSQAVVTKGPDEDQIKALLERTGYSLDVTTGQRKYGGPPPNYDQPAPVLGCELFVGRIPKSTYEDELVPIFEACGKIWDFRLMMDPLTSQNRGYGFITYCTKESAQNAVKQLDGHEIKTGKRLKVNVSVPNLRLFVGNIPKSKSKEEIMAEFNKLTAGLNDAIVYTCPDDKRKNRGFCFLEYESHKAASVAKRKLGTGRMKVFGCDIIVDWADPQEEPDEETMSKVKVLYVRNLTLEMTEEELRAMYEAYGKVDRVKKIKDYAFIHFAERDSAVSAMDETNGKSVAEGLNLEVSLAKPPSDRKRKEEVLRNRERRMGRGFVMSQNNRGRGMRPIAHGPGPRSYDFEYYGGYSAYRGGGPYMADAYYDEYYSGSNYDDYGYGYNAAPRGFGQMPHHMGDRMPQGARPHALGLAKRGGGGISRPRGSSLGARSNGQGNRRGAPMRSPMVSRGGNKDRGNISGKRKFDSGHQNPGASKRRLQNSRGGGGTGGSWGSQPIPQQPRGASGGDVEWYQDSYGQQWG